MKISSSKETVTDLVNEIMKKEGSSQEQRDFTGLDFTAWAYDLFNPDVPYAARGLNPYGNGFDRYIYGNKLTDKQYAWIGKQAKLSALNFISPTMFFINSITLKKYENGTKLRGNFAFKYYPTSFGNMIGLNLMFSKGKYNLLIAPQLNQNYNHTFPALEVMLFEYPIHISKFDILISPRVNIGAQPKNQNFMTSTAQFFGAADLNINFKINKYIYPYISLNTKTKGWAKGNEFLESKFSFKIGMSARFN